MTVPDEITKLIQSSGNSFHAKVARWFRDNGWHVVISPYYMDQTQTKAREIDLVAERLWPINGRFGEPLGHIAVRLFIECKFVVSDAVFWFADKDNDSALQRVCASGLFSPDNTYTERHHYLSQGQRVAKLFATSNNIKSAENEPFYKALNQSLNAMTSMRGQELTIPLVRKSGLLPEAVLEYPVVVCNSFEKLYCVDFFDSSEPRPIQDNFQLEVSYAYIDRNEAQRNEYFLLDFVAFNKLAEFGSAIDGDAKSGSFFASYIP
jgi:hypothetical protein